MNATAGKPIKCKAAVLRKSGEPLSIEEITVATPKAYEVRIKIIVATLCGTDVSHWKEYPTVLPRIMGHESVGVVESVGDNVTDFAVGDTVVPSWLPQCNECPDCLSTRSNLCSKHIFNMSPWVLRESTSRFTDSNGEVIYHFLYVSAFSEYTVVDIATITKLTDASIPVEKAVLCGCGVPTGVGAALHVAQVEAGSTVAVFGLGTIGAAVCEAARLRGASKIIGIDINPTKFEYAKKFGVTDTILAGVTNDIPIPQLIREMTDGFGADYCFECAGKKQVVEEAYASCRKGWGQTIVLGADSPEATLEFNDIEVLQREKVLRGSVLGGYKHTEAVAKLIDLYENYGLQLGEFATHQINFEDINKAFDLLVGGKSLRTLIWMDNRIKPMDFPPLPLEDLKL